MIADPATVLLTAHVAHWADDHPARTAWIIGCLHSHNTGDWGDLDPDDKLVNDLAVRQRGGRILSRYLVPDPLVGQDDDTDQAIWIITDDVADPDAVTTILWPSDY